MQTLNINRRYWLRGKGDSNYNMIETALNYNGKKCCLGHDLIQNFNAKPKDLVGCSMPMNYFEKEGITDRSRLNTIPVLGNYGDTKFARKASTINDAQDITDEVRERKLISLFKKYNVALTFYGKG
jgi:hypothetical protein